MLTGKEVHYAANGKLLVTYSNSEGSSVGVEFSSATQEAATQIFGVCASALGSQPRKLVSTASSGNTEKKSDGGGDNMEKRLAVLEVEVSHIKTDVSELKKSSASIESTVNSIDKNMAVVLEKLTTIKAEIDKKPSSDTVDKKISDAKLAVLLGVPAIIGIGTAVVKYAARFFS